MAEPIIEMKNIEKHFGSVIALAGVSLTVFAGECHCLLGDNGAGKSTFIKTMSGVYKPNRGEIFFEGRPMAFERPRDAINAGIATVYQDLAMIPLMSVTRNFFMGNEPTRKVAGLNFFDHKLANQVTMDEMRKMGIALRGPDQATALAEANADITEQQRLGNIPDAQRRIAALRVWAQGTIAADASADPNAAQSTLDAGGYDHLFANDLERVRAGQTIERALKTQRAVALADVRARMKNDLASIEATGTGIPGFRQEVAGLGSDKLAQYDEAATQARTINALIVNTKFVPFTETAAEIKPPEAGSENFAFEQKLFIARQKALQANAKAFEDDSYAYAARNSAVKTREQNIALQRVIMPGVDPRFFSKTEAAAVVKEYEAADGAKKIAAIASMVKQAGQNGGEAMQDLLEAKLPKSAKDRKSTRLNSSHTDISRMPSSA